MTNLITPDDKASMQNAYTELKTKNVSAKISQNLAALMHLVKKLRDPQTGCQWDKQQTRETIAPCLLEETNEVLAAIQANDITNLKEELGDVLFNILFLVDLSEEAKEFTLEDVMDYVLQKLVFRHPHVFGATDRSNITPEEALQLFKEAKKLEKDRKLNLK